MMYRLVFAFWLYTMIAYGTGCGKAASTAKQLPGGPDSPSVIAVSLDDAFTTVTPNGSEKVELTDARYFTPPNAINIVQGVYAGFNPGQYLHARIIIGAEVCEYQANGINLTVMSLQYCSGGVGPNTYLASGTEIELQNYDAPGFLVEAVFYLSR